ncbi:hypothetical protein [Hyphomicrobium sp. 2TAF46]|uniref:hypothetical protein n=1 Tax=Hyphomicrobium sp. 2TAF46 TaxID=3233019 RepID=UPI003F8E63CB
MKTLFSSTHINQDRDDDVLKGAIRLACDELIETDRFNSATISAVLDILALAILQKFTDGERSCDLIAEYAVAKVRANFRLKLH